MRRGRSYGGHLWLDRASLMSWLMKTHPRNSPFALPMTMTLLAMASWETIMRRSLMMAQGACSAAEYRRMAEEKATAMQLSTAALMSGRSQSAVLAPFVNRARANARRLRRKA